MTKKSVNDNFLSCRGDIIIFVIRIRCLHSGTWQFVQHWISDHDQEFLYQPSAKGKGNDLKGEYSSCSEQEWFQLDYLQGLSFL